MTTGALIAVYGVFGAWLIAEPATPSVWPVTAAGAGTWMLIGWRLAALERDGRIPLALLIMAGSGLGGSAMLFGEEMLAIGFVLVATGAGVGLAPNWLLSQMRVLAMAWLPLTGALAAGGLLLVLRHPAALPAVLSICLIFFAETAARRLEVGSGIWRRLSVPAARLLAAAAPVAVALLAAMVGARMDVGGL